MEGREWLDSKVAAKKGSKRTDRSSKDKGGPKKTDGWWI